MVRVHIIFCGAWIVCNDHRFDILLQFEYFFLANRNPFGLLCPQLCLVMCKDLHRVTCLDPSYICCESHCPNYRCCLVFRSFLRITYFKLHSETKKNRIAIRSVKCHGYCEYIEFLLVCAIFSICLLCYLQLTSTNFWISSLITCVHCLNWLKRENECRCKKKDPKKMAMVNGEHKNVKESKQLKSNGKKSMNQNSRAEKENRRCWLKRDDCNLNFLPAGLLFIYFIKATSKWPLIQYIRCGGEWSKTSRQRIYVWDKWERERIWPTGKYS